MLRQILPSQCRGARALLDLTQPQLAALAEVGLSTVVDFEKQRRVVSAEAIEKMRKALEVAGVIFVNEDRGAIGVLLKRGAAS